MALEIRLDRTGRLAKARKTASGFIRVDARATRVGVLEYLRADGSVQRELRHPDDVFRSDSLDSLSGVPVCDLHPTVMVDPRNRRELSRGTVRSVKQDGQFVAVELQIEDAELIQKIDNDERSELSCGYSCEYVAEPGVWQGQRFDGRQINVVYNHLAVGPRNWGRAGADVALRLDAADAPAVVMVSRFDDASIADDNANYPTANYLWCTR